MYLYLTADIMGTPSGGGIVTLNEYRALCSLGKEVLCVDRHKLHEAYANQPGGQPLEEPWGWDFVASHAFGNKIKLAHIYAGTFTKSVVKLKHFEAKVTYTAAAHSIELSRQEHEKLGIPYNYPHLTDPKLFSEYLRGYAIADVLVTPSMHSAKVMREFGCKNHIKVIPHGVDIPPTITDPPKTFTVGYLGAIGPDKGLIYLLQAWKKLGYTDAMLVLAGAQSASPFVQQLAREHGGGSIYYRGWVNDPADFYNSISLYVQPSVTEGFGIEVLEAMAHGRPVICSDGAGASDTVPNPYVFSAKNVDQLAELIDNQRKELSFSPQFWQANASQYTWDKVRSQYVDMWKGMEQ